MSQPLLDVRHLTKEFTRQKGMFGKATAVRAVDDVTFHINEGETFGLVGESGSGKTTTGRCILRLIEPTSGEVRFKNEDVLAFSKQRLREARREMQIVFQDPYSSLNPRMRVQEIVEEPLVIHRTGTRAERRARVVELFELVGLEPSQLSRYPHQFSGGQRQRIGLARALVLRPKFIVADEPVSALDVSIQSQVLNLLVELKHEFNLTYLFVAHDLAVVGYISDRVAVMYLGKIVELATSDELFRRPLHPYTMALLSANPEPVPGRKRQRVVLHGDVPSPINPPSGCRFRTRCPIAQQICAEVEPPLAEHGGAHLAACHFAGTSIAEAAPAPASS
jgi:oligopeptide transport system ATP-binding protein